MNVYAPIDEFRSALGITDTSRDDDLLLFMEAVSRDIDAVACRHFYTENRTNYYDGAYPYCDLLIDDNISVSEWLTDTDGDETYSSSWTETTDYILSPRSDYPKMKMRLAYNTSMSLGCARDYHKVTGVWGYGDGTADPWADSSITVTVADATTTTLTLSAEGTIKAGHTIKVGDEQMFITAVTSDSSNQATAERGVNGTTASAHSAAAAYIAQYPAQVVRAALWLGKSSWQLVEDIGTYESERIGDYSYKIASADKVEMMKGQILGDLCKGC
jgi:hypothetical protein